MNWYKRAQYEMDWESAYNRLKQELGREPTTEEIQKSMMRNLFDNKSKWKNKEPVLANTHKWKDKIPGGMADGKKPSDFNKNDVEKGHRVEFEHTDDPDTAREIAMDHLEEHDDYYIGLEHMENMLKDIEKKNKTKKKR